MGDGARLVRAWRQRRLDKGLKSVLIWLTPDEKRLLELQAVTYGEDFGRVVARLLRQTPGNGRVSPPAPLPSHEAQTQGARPASRAAGISREELTRIVETRQQHPTLSLSKLARLLYDRGIYRAKDRKTHIDKVVDTGTLARWLDQAGARGRR
jgi:hypothetical protein